MKKNLLSILILVLLLVNIALTSVMMISVIGTNKKNAELVTSIAAVMNLELIGPSGIANVEVPLADTYTYDVQDALLIPLNGSNGYITFKISLLLNTKHEDYKKISKDIGTDTGVVRDSLIMDIVNEVVSAHTEEECRNDFGSVRDEILKALQQRYQTGCIYYIAISGVQYG